MDICKERCEKIMASGANVVLCSRGIDDFALKYFVEAGVIAVIQHNNLCNSPPDKVCKPESIIFFISRE